METTYNKLNGQFLGYPECCITAFGDVAEYFAKRPLVSQQAAINGFIPCPECASKLLKKEVTYEELINPNRKCSIPFSSKEQTPDEHNFISQELYINQINH